MAVSEWFVASGEQVAEGCRPCLRTLAALHSRIRTGSCFHTNRSGLRHRTCGQNAKVNKQVWKYHILSVLEPTCRGSDFANMICISPKISRAATAFYVICSLNRIYYITELCRITNYNFNYSVYAETEFGVYKFEKLNYNRAKPSLIFG